MQNLTEGSFKGCGYVCFIDILGFSNEITKNWNNEKSNPLDKLLAIKNALPISTNPKIISNDSTHRTYECRVSTVSDSVTICFGFNEKLIIGDMVLALHAMIYNISCIWSMFISQGFTIRGAIDFGDIYWDTNELIGPAFINAYRLESEIAKTSRVIISSNLNQVISNIITRHDGDIFERMMTLFRKDVDGYIIIDPLQLFETDESRNEIITNLECMKSKNTNSIIKEKYSSLIYYLRENTPQKLSKQDFGNY